MRRSPFSRARVDGGAAPGASDVVPLVLEAALAVAEDDDARTTTRLAAIARLEHGAGAHAVEVARRLTPLLAAPPDVAARVHLALLVLAPRLAVARAPDGGFVASAHGLDACEDHGVGRVDPALGRVAGLDALAVLFGPDESLPAFLHAPASAAPTPYRPAADVLARRAAAEQAREAERQRARDAAVRRAQLAALGLDEDDLADDAEERLRPARRVVPRRDAAVAFELDAPIDVAIETDGGRVALGVAQPGAWWSDVRAGDHKGSQRLYLRLAGREQADTVRVRRTPRIVARDGAVAVVFGRDRVEIVVSGTALLAFVEEEQAGICGVTVTWSVRGGARVQRSS